MIRSLTVINAYNESLTLELERPDLSGLAIKSITGVGVPQMNVIMSESFYDGAMFGHVRAQPRNILITLWPRDEPLVETARQMTYRYFQLKQEITLIFRLDNRIVSIKGHVESNEPTIFDFPETIDISILCPQPYFEAYIPFAYNFYDAVPLFEFPFENDSLTEPLLEFGEVSPNNSINLEYEGEVESGVEFILRFGGVSVGDISIYNQETNQELHISASKFYDLASKYIGAANATLGANVDQIIRINTSPLSQRAVLEFRGNEYNIIPALGYDIQWLTVRPGRQEFVFISRMNTDTILMSVQYSPRYVGL